MVSENYYTVSHEKCCCGRLQPDCTFLRGVDFIKAGRMAQIIEMALLKLGPWRKARSTPLKSFSKVGPRAQKSL